MAWNPFAPCDAAGCDEHRTYRRKWCAEHAANVDRMKSTEQCGERIVAKREAFPPLIRRCGLIHGHPGDHKLEENVVPDAIGLSRHPDR